MSPHQYDGCGRAPTLDLREPEPLHVLQRAWFDHTEAQQNHVRPATEKTIICLNLIFNYYL